MAQPRCRLCVQFQVPQNFMENFPDVHVLAHVLHEDVGDMSFNKVLELCYPGAAQHVLQPSVVVSQVVRFEDIDVTIKVTEEMAQTAADAIQFNYRQVKGKNKNTLPVVTRKPILNRCTELLGDKRKGYIPEAIPLFLCTRPHIKHVVPAIVYPLVSHSGLSVVCNFYSLFGKDTLRMAMPTVRTRIERVVTLSIFNNEPTESLRPLYSEIYFRSLATARENMSRLFVSKSQMNGDQLKEMRRFEKEMSALVCGWAKLTIKIRAYDMIQLAADQDDLMCELFYKARASPVRMEMVLAMEKISFDSGWAFVFRC